MEKDSPLGETMTDDNFPVSFESDFKEKHITAIIDIGGTKIGLRFDSVKFIFEFFAHLMKPAYEMWPDDPMIKAYFGDTEE